MRVGKTLGSTRERGERGGEGKPRTHLTDVVVDGEERAEQDQGGGGARRSSGSRRGRSDGGVGAA